MAQATSTARERSVPATRRVSPRPARGGSPRAPTAPRCSSGPRFDPSGRRHVRVIAIDWSGRVRGEQRAIWLAEADTDGSDGGDLLARLECGRTRHEVAAHLVDLAGTDRDLVVGIDCSFSLPAWFLDERGYATVDDLWLAATELGEQWLAACDPPFWGRAGRTKPDLPSHFRETESAIAAVRGAYPKS